MHKIAIICPGKHAGGTNLLLGRVAQALNKKFDFDLTLVDFEDGYLRQWYQHENIPHQFLPYRAGTRCEIFDCDVAIIPVLPASLIGRTYDIAVNTKLIMWSTAPQDIFKYIPLAYFFNWSSWEKRRWLVRTVFFSQGKRISAFIKEASERKGLIFMDQHNVDVNARLFGLIDAPTIVPICTGSPPDLTNPCPIDSRKAYWVGRIEDFKTEPLRAALKALLSLNSGLFEEIVLIGDGEDLIRVRREFNDPILRWRGAVSPRELDIELKKNASLVFGHGTSVLEAAKLSIPALVIDGSYEPIPAGTLKAEWLHNCSPSYIGKICPPRKFTGRSIWECLQEFEKSKDAIGRASYAHWEAYHSPDRVATKLKEVITLNDYSIRDFLKAGGNSYGPVGRLIQHVKHLVGRKY